MSTELAWMIISGIATVVCAVVGVIGLKKREISKNTHKQNAIGSKIVQSGRDSILKSSMHDNENQNG